MDERADDDATESPAPATRPDGRAGVGRVRRDLRPAGPSARPAARAPGRRRRRPRAGGLPRGRRRRSSAYDPDPAKGSFRGWLSTIARNLIVNLLDAQRRHPRGTGDSEVRRLLEEQPAPDSQQSAVFDAEYRLRVLDWAAERVRDEFPEAVWQAFWKTGVEGQSAEEAARVLGLSVGTVYQYKSRVVARIRREIERVSS